jgi:hypothetical protein
MYFDTPGNHDRQELDSFAGEMRRYETLSKKSAHIGLTMQFICKNVMTNNY